MQIETKESHGGTQYYRTVSWLQTVSFVSFRTDCFTFIFEELVSQLKAYSALFGISTRSR